MKLKKLLAFLTALIICLSFSSCGEENYSSSEESSSKGGSSEINKEGPLLYKVTDENGNVIWLFGSIHVGRDDFYPLPDYVLDAFESSDSLAVEFDIVAFENDEAALTDIFTMLVFSDGSTIEDHIPKDLYDEAVEILKDNKTYGSYLDYFIPSLWTDLINSFTYEEIDADFDLGIDRHLIDLAYEKDKEVLDIESAEFQCGMTANYSMELQIVLLESAVSDYYEPDKTKEELEKTQDIWLKGDEKEFSDYLNQEKIFEDEEEERLYEEYNKAMLYDRNINMADYAEDALLSGEEVFICVGAAHVVGEDAMVELLRERGYTVEIVR